MDYPMYKQSYRKFKCYNRNVYINSVATYQYIPEKNVYRLIKRTCSLNLDHGNPRRCNGKTKYGEFCDIIYCPPVEIAPDSREFDEQERLTD